MNDYLVRIRMKMLFRNASYYWQHNELTDTEECAGVVGFFRQEFGSRFQDFGHVRPLSAFPPSLFDAIFETAPNEFRLEIKDFHCDENLKHNFVEPHF